MNQAFVRSIAVLLAGAGFALAQPPAPPTPPAPPVPPSPTLPPAPVLRGPISPYAPLVAGYDPAAAGPACEALGCPDCGYGAPAPGGIWLSAEYLLWWFKDARLPPLVTVGTVESLGILGQPGTRVIIGGRDIDQQEFSGGRFFAGAWLDECRNWGLEGGYFFLGPRFSDFGTSCDRINQPVLARPFFNASTGDRAAELICFPGLVEGNINVRLASRLQGAEANVVGRLWCGCHGTVDMLAGFSFLELDEGLSIIEDAQISPESPVLPGANVRVSDQFDTRNRFYGGQIGARAEVRRGSLFVNARGTVAFGVNDQDVGIFGATTIGSPDGGGTTIPAGLLALRTNSGQFDRDCFAVVPQLNVNIGVNLGDGFRVFAGYTFLYWTDVARPGDQIDLVLNETQIPTSATFGPLVGPARPRALLRDTDFWAQGVSFGLEYRY